MKKRLTRIISAIVTCVLLISLIPAIPVSATNNSSIQKLPDVYTEGTGSFTITANSRFLLVSNSEPTAEQKEFAQFISQQFAGAELPSKTTLPIVWGPENYKKAGDIVLKFDNSLAAESYKIVVDANNITITGADKRGQMYGAFMVIKTMRANGSKTISGCTIQDTPDAAERTVLLDCGRKYFTAEWIKNYIKEMAYMGYNTFEFHFAEDQGFRIDIWDENFTSANGNDFSWLAGGMVGSWVNSNYQNYADKRKYLTAKEVVEILEVAAQYQIDVIPSYDTPMHCQYLRRMWNAHIGGTVASEISDYYTVDKNYSFNYNGKNYSSAGIKDIATGKVTTYDSYYDNWNNIQSKCDAGDYSSSTKTIDVTNAVGRNLMLAITEDFAKFFAEHGCKEFNICADEVAFYRYDHWAGYAQDVLGLTNGTKYDTLVHYLNEMTDMVQSYGYNVRAFCDFVDRTGGYDTDFTASSYAEASWFKLSNPSVLDFDPELEIVYWELPYTNTGVRDVTHFISQGDKIYNAVENYNYYVLALYQSQYDDRGGYRFNWKHISAENLWNLWNPTVFSFPDKTTCVVDADDVDGGYFLIWSDYGALSTEAEIWNGIDSTGKYNVIERMWSNVTKMWNYDVNTTSNSEGQLTYANFATLRGKLGDFPGYSGNCTVANTLPAAKAVTRAYLGDHTALRELLAQEIDGSIYNQESWSNYETARAAAVKVDANYGATQAELDAAVANLQSAIDNLSTKTYIADHSKLVALLEKSLNKDDYTPSSWQNYQTVYAAGETVHKNYDATQAEVDTATANLQAAINALTPVADFSALIAQLERVFNQNAYMEDSWKDYEAARNAALEVRNNLDATQEQVNEATENLISAIDALKPVPFLTIQHWTMVGGTPVKFAEEGKGAPEAEAGKSFSIEIPGRPGYDLASVENCEFTPYTSGADGGYITGYFTEPAIVKIWYTNMPDTQQLEALTETIYDSTDYSDDSWKAYEDAVKEAEEFLAKIAASPSTSTHQEEIQKYVDTVLSARNALESAAPIAESKILDLKVPVSTVAKGKKAILVITTTADVSEITIDGVTKLTDHLSQPAVVNGQAVKLWYITFRINAIGTKGYTVHAGSATQTVEITCK